MIGWEEYWDAIRRRPFLGRRFRGRCTSLVRSALITILHAISIRCISTLTARKFRLLDIISSRISILREAVILCLERSDFFENNCFSSQISHEPLIVIFKTDVFELKRILHLLFQRQRCIMDMIFLFSARCNSLAKFLASYHDTCTTH